MSLQPESRMACIWGYHGMARHDTYAEEHWCCPRRPAFFVKTRVDDFSAVYVRDAVLKLSAEFVTSHARRRTWTQPARSWQCPLYCCACMCLPRYRITRTRYQSSLAHLRGICQRNLSFGAVMPDRACTEPAAIELWGFAQSHMRKTTIPYTSITTVSAPCLLPCT